MDIKFDCDKCGQNIEIDGAGAGTIVECPKCGKSITVPAAAAIPPGIIPIPAKTKCPYCAEEILSDATKCQHCGEFLNGVLKTQRPTPSVLKNTFIDLLRAEYTAALSAIDNEVKTLIENGQEAKSLMLLMDNFRKINELRETLSTYYSIFFWNVEVLKKFSSERLMQVGQELLPIYETAKGEDSLPQVEVEWKLMQNFCSKGVPKKNHWFISSIVLTEIEYMLDMLQILIEPDFLPLSEPADAGDEISLDRYIVSVILGTSGGEVIGSVIVSA